MKTKIVYGTRNLLCAFAVMIALAFAACDDGSTGGTGGGGKDGSSNDISLDSYSLSLTVGQSSVLTATVLPDTASQNVVWTSSNPIVAAVANGTVTGVSAGTATITVIASADPSKTATCNVTVTGGSNPQPSGSYEMVFVPGGSFQMGNTAGDGYKDGTVHTVTLTGFFMGKYQVTQTQYQAVMGTTIQQQNDISSDPGLYGVGDNYPMYHVSWYDALVFCNKLSMAEGLTPAYRISDSTDPAAWGSVPTSRNSTWNAVTIDSGSTGYRLPTEAQWEYAAKGGNGSPGNYTYAGSNTVGDVAWYEDNSGSTTHAVGTKVPNGLGLYDMSGNVGEWCWDWYGHYSSEAQTDPMGASGASSGSTIRVVRGGSWSYPAEFIRSTERNYLFPSVRGTNMGFRLARPAQ